MMYLHNVQYVLHDSTVCTLPGLFTQYREIDNEVDNAI